MKHYLRFLVIVGIITLSLQDSTNNEVDSQEESPLADIANEILKEKNIENIGGMLGSFLQSEGGKMILDSIMEKVTDPQNIGQVTQILGSLSNTESTAQKENPVQKPKSNNDEVNPMELLSGLGSIVGALQGGNGEGGAGTAALLQGLGSLFAAGQGGNNAAGLLQGLGSLLASTNQNNQKENDSGGAAILQGLGSLVAAAAANNQGGGNNLGILEGLGSLLGDQNGQGGINPELIGNVINMFAQNAPQPSKSTSSKSVKSKPKKTKRESKKNDNEFDLSDAINLASSFLNPGKGKSGSSFMDYLPMIMNTINAFTGPEAKERADSHTEHKGTIPAILEKIHVFFDNFLHSDMAKNVLNYIGTEKAFKVFQDESGKFDYNKFQELVENHSFRKHWIKQITQRLVEFLKFLANEKTQNQYIYTGLSFVNAFLKSNGFPQNALINLKNPVKSITNFVNYGAKKYLDADDIDAKEYVKPAVLYVQDLLKMARQAIVINKEPKELIDKLTDTINMDFIEPITRVNRAYRFARTQPTCDRYVFCLINQQVSNSGSLPSLNKGLSKGSSLIAAWFASSNTGTSYWDLYSDITDDKNCQKLFNKNCEGFHEDEIRVTTEYVHNEL
ncbi:uncharacterized protein LOC143191835 isoform X2 [Rhynchophorus ferrugineus]|uniref:uncharacterized protein LOC143191835 isoform X2 n=1 Tax=Rhynchophorus ferrugineus TaxID=354439 RepID=UPI003FCD5689